MTGFTFISGNLGLDLAGTVQHRRSDRTDLLRDPAELARWTVEAGILDVPPAVGDAELAAGKTVREAIYRLATGVVPGGALPSEEDRRLVNRIAAGPPASVRLNGAGRVERDGDLDAALSTVAREAVQLLGGPRAVQIKECGGEVCTRLYVDASRGSSRRWCDMHECGNRAKAAGFRARRRAPL
ncbi:ABATE domain-containing protein [Nonomuraea sp. NEAU-A123]|uniref:CGNR zinc finger domain-containing protein n=1 Tax=Nonomuraea sp. NEAU-A123 TaxID=2839649 RepID=UPI001BE3D458|nr:ABATE domain-containing protein [Nonomuraea sp. NEAU-A123]MBT2230055.1 ABATE domain-containing protein [Nonomuraea sp. NEAU-A123]MBT2230675.1 ABATE domain-containing protein [Nonomuraea sp. NEAU-A123]